ncbi:hypothetical protein BC828DRAFT_62044 [Blastocladiella britannica]|nr:hypothetical protein BC828DRAFT_62044 [Blastocladiella britannica]
MARKKQQQQQQSRRRSRTRSPAPSTTTVSIPAVALPVRPHPQNDQQNNGRIDALDLMPFELWVAVLETLERWPSSSSAVVSIRDPAIHALLAVRRTCSALRAAARLPLARLALRTTDTALAAFLDHQFLLGLRSVPVAAAVGTDPILTSPMDRTIPPVLLDGPPSGPPPLMPQSDSADVNEVTPDRSIWARAMTRYLIESFPPTKPSLPSAPAISKLPTLLEWYLEASSTLRPPDRYTSDFFDWHGYRAPVPARTHHDDDEEDDWETAAALSMEELRLTFNREGGRRGKAVSRAWMDHEARNATLLRDTARALAALGAALEWRWTAKSRDALTAAIGTGPSSLAHDDGSSNNRTGAREDRNRARRDRVWAGLMDIAAEQEQDQGLGVAGLTAPPMGPRRRGPGASQQHRESARPSVQASSSSPGPEVDDDMDTEAAAAQRRAAAVAAAVAEFHQAHPWAASHPDWVLDLIAMRALVQSRLEGKLPTASDDDSAVTFVTDPAIRRALAAATPHSYNLDDTSGTATSAAAQVRMSSMLRFSSRSPEFLARAIVAFAQSAADRHPMALRFPCPAELGHSFKSGSWLRRTVHIMAQAVDPEMLVTESFGRDAARFVVVVARPSPQPVVI